MTSRPWTTTLATCLYVHPDNVQLARRELAVHVAIIARPDAFMQRTSATQVIVETERGIHNRVYIGKHAGIPFLIIYGRVDRERATSAELGYALNQEVVSFLGVSCLIGCFVVGSVRAADAAGTIYV